MKTKKFLVLVLAVLFMLVVVPSVSATTGNTVATLTLNKVLKPSAGDVFPNTTDFIYVLTPYSVTPAETGTTSTSNVTSATVMPQPANNGQYTVTVNETKVVDGATVKVGETAATLDFANYPAGVYTYTLQEDKKGTTEAGITYDNNMYYVNVYVINDTEGNAPDGKVEGTTHIAFVTVWKNVNAQKLDALSADTSTLAQDGEDGKVAKSTTGELSYPFENTFETVADIHLIDYIKGNYANVTDPFTYTVILDNTGSSDVIVVEYYKNGELIEAPYGNPETITPGQEATIKLANDEEAVFKDLASSTTYTITQTRDKTYSTTLDIKDGDTTIQDTKEVAVDSVEDSVIATGRLSDNTVVGNVLNDENVIFTNTKQYTPPTGVVLSVLPFVLGLVVVAVVYFVTSKKREVEEI